MRAAADRAARRGTLQRGTVRVVFLVHNKDAWDSIGEVIQIMRASSDFEPVVVTIPHHYGGGDESRGEGRIHRFLAERGVPHLRLRNDEQTWARELLLALDPDVVFRQSQWDSDVDSAFSAENLAWARLALIPYETMNPTKNVPWDHPPVNSALDQHWHRAAWLVFVANEDVVEIARTDTLTGGSQYRAVGHPKADALRKMAPFWPSPEVPAKRRRVLWSAHHSILDGWNDFGMFPQVKDDMLRWASEDLGTEFVFTHHPYLRGTLRRPESPLKSADFKDWLAMWRALPNTVYWRGEYAPVLAATDLLVTDGPSMITESQVLTVPTLFLERDEHVEFNRVGERIVSGVHRVPDVAAARAIAELISEKGDPLASTQRENIRRLFGEPGAAQRIVDTILAEAQMETSGLR
ncbi:hypothetical protein GCM10025760_28220 [Microbacterium yannicii]|uniref:UDP-N-acetylglucosamine 2-epimerase domain-containing protein n=1 Tax=Microbacterium yannicii TaxID=671622 RepID=A0ABP9MF08_9MICO